MRHDKIVRLDYKTAGVDIAAGEAAVKAIKTKVRSTYNANVLSDLGSFGGLYRMDKAAYQNPILVSSADGVGTKLMVAIAAGVYHTVGQDLVNHCVDDILVQGAIPQFFLDYIGVGKLEPKIIERIIDGFIQACQENSCALIGGEMAEMPGVYKVGDFDLAGTIVGVVEESQLLPRQTIGAGDILVGLPSTGLHTNGYSLARKVFFEAMKLSVDSYVPELCSTVAEALLKTHKSYLNELKPYLCNPALHGMAHITGGGIGGNLARILPEGIGAEVSLSDSSIPDLFHVIRQGGNIEWDVMRQTFNLGIGMICVVDSALAESLVSNIGGRVLGELIPSSADTKVVFI